MAKKEVEVVEQNKIADLTKELLKKYGRGVVVTADYVLQQPKTIISVSPVLDIALSGGIPQGCMCLFSGKPKTGKSTTALQFAANCQKEDMPVFYLDVEGRIVGNHKLLNGIHGLDPDKVNIITSTEDCILSAIDFLTIAEDIIKTIPKALVIIDSASSLCDASERTEDMTPNARAKGPKLMATFCRRTAGIISIKKSIVVIIQHLIANTSGYGVPFMEDGGNKIVHAADVKMRAKGFSDWVNTDKVIIGQSVKWDIAFSAEGAPGAQVDSFIRYGYGIDEEWELINLALEIGIISQSGSWFTLDFLTKHDKPTEKYQGQEKVWEAIRSNPEYKKWLTEDIKAML